MKKFILIISAILALTTQLNAQSVDSTGIKDSTEITLNMAARDVEYISGFIFGNEFYENLVDSIRPAYRKLVNPSASTPVLITGCTKDFIEVLKMLRNDVVAIKADADKRLTTLLKALNVPYINQKLAAFAESDTAQFQYGRAAGKFRLTRKR